MWKPSASGRCSSGSACWEGGAYGGTETASYPLTIYRPAFRSFFTYVVPLGCVIYFPAVAIFGIEDPLGTSRAFQVLAPGAGFAFLALALTFWRFGIRHYTSTGS